MEAISMKVIVECSCGNRVEVESETRGKVAYFEQALMGNGFSIDTPSIDIELQYDEVTDPDDVEATLKEICIRCDNCDEYICLDF